MMSIEQGLDFILEHFEEPKFPRTISTSATRNRQVIVNSRQEVLVHFKKAGLEDCRISAFSKNEIELVKPNLIFVDLDDVSALDGTLYQFGKIGARPLVIATGNGFAIVQPIMMDSWKELSCRGKTGEELAKMFLQFASRYLSNNRCDSGNHPSLRSCLIRVPASINSKNKKIVDIQTFWDKNKVSVKSLPFKKYVNSQTRKAKASGFPSGYIPYVERLLGKKIRDCRKRACNLVLLPYLINVKKLSADDAMNRLYDYFDGHIPKPAIMYNARLVLKKGILPYGLAKMRHNDPDLYNLVTFE